MRKVAGIIQARTGSTRLPGKVLKELAGRPMLVWILDRVRLSTRLQQVLVATTRRPEDDALATLCSAESVGLYRGSADDVLSRYQAAAAMAGAEIVVRITGDSPFVDPRVIDLAIAEYFDRARGEQAPDCLKTRGFPLGINVEVFTAEALGRAARLAKTRREREHVTLGMYERPDVFSVSTLDAEADRSEMRWTVDTPEDLLFARTVFSLLERVDFSWRDVMALVDADPSLAAINAHIRQRVA